MDCLVCECRSTRTLCLVGMCDNPCSWSGTDLAAYEEGTSVCHVALHNHSLGCTALTHKKFADKEISLARTKYGIRRYQRLWSLSAYRTENDLRCVNSVTVTCIFISIWSNCGLESPLKSKLLSRETADASYRVISLPVVKAVANYDVQTTGVRLTGDK
jgi:hypothetical protein